MANPTSLAHFHLQDWHRTFVWTQDADQKLIAAYILGFSMGDCLRRVEPLLYHVRDREAKGPVCARLNALKAAGELPRDWQRAYNRNTAMTTEEEYTLREDVELLQWAANGKKWINAKIFVGGNRSAAGMRKRAEWLCSLPGLNEKAIRIEREATEVLTDADYHAKARERPCERCDLEALPTQYPDESM